LEPKVAFLYYIAIWKACVGEVDIASTSAQHIVSGEFLKKVDSWINEVKANQADRSFEDKYSIRAIASYNRIVARDIVPQDIYTIKHVYNLNKIIRTWYVDSRKGLRVEVVVTLIKKPIPETTSIYASPYSLGVELLQRVLPASALLLNILKARAISGTPKKKGNISATVT
jgi:hypothetical protein